MLEVAGRECTVDASAVAAEILWDPARAESGDPVVERRTTGRTRAQVEVAETVRQVVGPPAVHSLLQDLDELRL